MDPLVQIALAGTARTPQAEVVTGVPVDRLVASLGAQGRERRLLLLAGAGATYRLAGHSATSAASGTEPCPPEARPTCSPGAAALLRPLFGGEHAQLLPEALACLRQAGRVLTPDLLPAALDQRDPERRDAVSHVLGERGRWLARCNPAWSWATTATEEAEGVPADAEAIWQEGESSRRLDIFRRVRAADPGRAREWLRAAWRQEKADVRIKLVAALEQRLGPEDETLLEAALDDRSANVRAEAARQLARLAGSAFVARMLARAEQLLAVVAGKLEATPPRAWDATWQRDGIAQKPADGMGERAWWLTQMLSFVPPGRWQERFRLSPSDLIAAAAESSWASALLRGWSEAALLHGDAEWIGALWDWWFQLSPSADSRKARHDARQLVAAVPAEELLSRLPAAEAERRALRLLADPQQGNVEFHEVVNALPALWSDQFGDAYLQALRAHVAGLSFQRQDMQDPWLYTLERAAVALPAGCFAAALRSWELPGDSAQPAREYWSREIETFTSTLRMRQRLVEEIQA